MTRLWINGELLEMQTDAANCPLGFNWHGQEHPVERIANRWRIDEQWWARRVWRDYFKLVTTTGWLVIVYRDLVDGRWYLQRLYD